MTLDIENPQQETAFLEKTVSPQELIELLIATTEELILPEAAKLPEEAKKIKSDNPDFNDLEEGIDQIPKDLKELNRVTKTALEGREVRLVRRPGGRDFLYLETAEGVHIRETDIIITRVFQETDEDLIQLALSYDETLENTTRQDAQRIRGAAENIGMERVGKRFIVNPRFNPIIEQTVRVASITSEMGKTVKGYAKDKNIPVKVNATALLLALPPK